MIGKSVMTSLLAFLIGSAVAQDAEIKAAQALIDHDKKKAAVELLQKAITTYPVASNLYFYLGNAQLQAGDQAGAKASYDKGAETFPKEPLNFVGQGRILVLEKKGAQAKPLFDKALGFGKKNTTTINAIAEAYLSDKDKTYQKDAMALLTRSKELNEANFTTQMLLGDAYFNEKMGGPCASAYERAAEIDPKSGAPGYKLAYLFSGSSDLEQVEKNLKQSVTADPEYAISHRELGELYYKKKDGANAVKHYKIYLDLTDNPDKDGRFKYAFFLFLAREYDKANKEFEELTKKPDVSSNTLKFYAQSLLKSGNLAKCQEVYEKYLGHTDTKVDADDYNNYSDLLKKQGKDSLAMNALEKSISIDQNQNDVLQALIKYNFDKKKYSQAEKFCRISAKVRKTPYANDYFNLGRALYLQQKYVNADSAFAKLNELQPKFVLGYIWTARSKSAQDGDLRDQKAKIEWLAKPAYDKVIEIGEADKDKNKKDLIEAYQYMVGHHLYKQDLAKGKEYLNKILAVDPENKDAKEALNDLNNPQTQQKPKKKVG
ncbi:hypothetical protein WSM22_27970 [Cytophagales bacterium WSM2-2]|nr:hypothetical protein WSM22_27970 [Cytophagales bacterium WSM2-2]